MTEPTTPSGNSPLKKIGIGVTMVALPAMAAVAVWQIKEAEDANNDRLERGFKYDDKALRQVDPALIGWEEIGQLQTGQERPTCMAIAPDGVVIVGGDRLVSIQSRTPVSFEIPAAATAIAADAAGNIYVAMKGQLDVYSRSGEKITTFPSIGERAHISSIAVSRDAVYLADSGLLVGRVVAFTPEGKWIGEIARRDSAAGIKGISTPSPHMDVAVTPEGNIWVANPGNHQLELYTPAGELLRSFGEAGVSIEQFLGCCNPSDFALLADGRIVTAEKGVARVKVYSDDGHMVNVVAPPTAFGGNRAGIDLAADAEGRVLLLEPGTNVIRVFAEKRS